MEIEIKEEHRLEAYKIYANTGKLAALKYLMEQGYKGLKELKDWIDTSETYHYVDAIKKGTYDSTAKRFSINDIIHLLSWIDTTMVVEVFDLDDDELKELILKFAKEKNI